MKTQMKADIMIVLVALCWGSSCLVTKFALEDLQEFNLTAIRFLVGFAPSFILFYRRLNIDKTSITFSAALAANYFVVMAFFSFGVQYTSVSKAGLLTCLAGVFVPVINFLVFRKRIGAKTVFCALATVFGVYILSMGGVNETLGLNIGDMFCVLCSLFFAIHIMLVGFAVKRVDAVTLTVFQTGFVGFYSLLAAFLLETPGLPQTAGSWFSVLWLSVICGVIAMLLQNTAQKYTSDTHAGIIFTIEPVFAVFLAYLFLGETLTFYGYIGGAIILACIVLLEINFTPKRLKS